MTIQTQSHHNKAPPWCGVFIGLRIMPLPAFLAGPLMGKAKGFIAQNATGLMIGDPSKTDIFR